MPTTDKQDKSEEQKRAGKFLTEEQRWNLWIEITSILVLAGLIIALAAYLFAH